LDTEQGVDQSVLYDVKLKNQRLTDFQVGYMQKYEVVGR